MSKTINERSAESCCRAENAASDVELDRLRDQFERVRKRTRPTHYLARNRQDTAIAEVGRQLDADLKAPFLPHGVSDNRYT